jgi:glutamyl-tRNA synthetase
MPFLERGLSKRVKRPISQDYVRQIMPLIQERMRTLAEGVELASFFFVEELDYKPTTLLERGLTRERALKALKTAKERLADLSFEASSLEGVLRPLAAELELKTGELFGLLRVTTTGRTAAPPLFETMAVLGRERCLTRIEAALERLTDKG